MQIQKLEEGTHHIKLMPNYFNPQEYLIDLPVCAHQIGKLPTKINNFFAYIKREEEAVVKPVMIPRKLAKAVTAAMAGDLVLTHSGEIVGYDHDIVGYTLEDGKINPVLSLDNQDESIIVYNDIKKLEPTNFFDLKSTLKIIIEVYYVRPIPNKPTAKFKDYKITISNLTQPLYDDTEEGKERIKKMYAGTPKLQEIVDLYKTEISKDLKSDVLLFGKDAERYYYKNKFLKLTRPGTIEFLGHSAGIEIGKISEKDLEIKITFPDGIDDIDNVSQKAAKYFDGEISHKEEKLIIINADLKMVGYTLLFSFRNHYEKC